jgi:hypothetical protein
VNNYLLDKAVKFALGIGAEILHLGGGRTSLADDSLLKFKSNFSRTQISFYIGKKIHNPAIYSEVLNQWKLRNFEKEDQYKNYLLKYRI